MGNVYGGSYYLAPRAVVFRGPANDHSWSAAKELIVAGSAVSGPGGTDLYGRGTLTVDAPAIIYGEFNYLTQVNAFWLRGLVHAFNETDAPAVDIIVGAFAGTVYAPSDEAYAVKVTDIPYAVFPDGTVVRKTGGPFTVALAAAPSGANRIDLLVMDSTGAFSWVQGTPAGSPSPPARPYDKLPLAEVFLHDGASYMAEDDQGSGAYLRPLKGALGRIPVVLPIVLVGNGNDGTVAAGGTRYAGPGYTGLNSTEGVVETRSPCAGSLMNLRFVTGSAQPAGGSLVGTVRVNGAGTAITATVGAGAGAGVFSDTSHLVSVAAGDRIALQFVNNDGGNASASLRGISLELAI